MGHLFVGRGDLTALNCDAWLLPTDRTFTLTSTWKKALPDDGRAGDWVWEDGKRTMPWPDWKADAPRPWLTLVGSARRNASWYVEGASQFVAEAAAALQGTRPRAGRTLPLLALPLVGTGGGGAFHDKGAVSSALVRSLTDQVRLLEADVVLVTASDSALAACQFARRSIPRLWNDLRPSERAKGDELAVQAERGRLAFFIGAGLSVGAGLPTWGRLLDDLCIQLGLPAKWTRAMRQMSLLDRAQLLSRRHGDALRQAVSNRIGTASHYSLGHCLLASIPHREAVTQNYDCLYEAASRAAGHEAAVLPYKPGLKERWLLKMHGCVEHPDDIVLSRQDFLRYSTQRGALAGLVQGLLLTRHLVFVGFSLTDENFLAIVDEVRRARRDFSDRKLGTALLLQENEALRDLWEADLDLLALRQPRRFEIFLDYVLSRVTDSRHLLDETFEKSLEPAERWLRDQLNALENAAGADVRATSAWRAVERMLQSLGRQT